ncbi:MAG: DUF885 family protein [Sphingomonadales bacterium]
MKKKYVLWPLAAIFAGGVFWLSNLVWFKPFSINHYFERVFIETVIRNPELLTQLRMLEQFGIDFHNDDLTDISQKEEDWQWAKLHRDNATLNSYDEGKLDDGQRLSKRILTWFMENQLEQEAFRYHDYPVNQLFGLQNNFPSFMDTFHQVKTVEEGEDYIARLSKVGVKFGQAMEGLRIREEKGVIPPTFVIEKVLEEMTAFVAEPPAENLLHASFERKLAEAEDIDEAARERLLSGVAEQIEITVYPAYQSFIDYFTALKPKSTNDAGVWKLPDGAQYYQTMLRQYTTTDLTADEIHQLGLSEVARIQGAMVAILAGEGYDPNLGFTTLITQLAEEERFYYPDSDEGRAQILTGYQSILDEINAGLDEAFRLRPKAGVEVRRVPEFKEKTAPGAYYNRPAFDGSRPGIFFANLYDIKATPKFGMHTLAYHEGIPGHHFQIAIMQELGGLPTFRNILGFTAYVEGWALYAERLAWELGFEGDPYDNLGRLQGELMRAVRLVVDTGIHHRRWTREAAISYMATNTGMALSDVTAEIERYIVMPGQATAYKVGMMEILRLREQARQALGDAFDLRDFHDVVLGNGSVPLTILRELVEEYIAGKQAAT